MGTALGERLRRARVAKGENYSQEKLALDSGVTRGTIWNIETGKQKDIKSTHLIRICDALEIRPRWLVLGEGSMHELPLHRTEIDADALSAIIEGVYQAIHEHDVELTARSVARIVRFLYQTYMETGHVPPTDTIQSLIEVASGGDNVVPLRGKKRD